MRTSNETIKVKANHSKRTFEMSKEEFESEEMNTENDWKQFLKSDNYYKI